MSYDCDDWINPSDRSHVHGHENKFKKKTDHSKTKTSLVPSKKKNK